MFVVYLTVTGMDEPVVEAYARLSAAFKRLLEFVEPIYQSNQELASDELREVVQQLRAGNAIPQLPFSFQVPIASHSAFTGLEGWIRSAEVQP